MADEYGIKLGMDHSELVRKADVSKRKLHGVGTAGAAAGTQVQAGSVKATRGLQGTAAAATQARSAMAGLAAVVGGGAFLRSAINQSREFGRSMAEVSTLLNDLTGFDSVAQDIQQLSIQFGSSNVEQAQALYQTISAGAGSAAEAMETLDTANRLAVGGVSDVETSVTLLSQVLNAYGDNIDGAKDASDALFTGVKAGVTTIDQLGGSLGKVIPMAVSAKIPFEDLVATVSTLTAQGFPSTAEAVTGIRGALTAVIKPTQQARDMAEQLGVEFNLAALQSKGLQQFLAEIRKEVGDDEAALAQLFSEVEGLNAIMTLTGEEGMAKLNTTMQQMEERAGATEAAFQKMKDTPDQEMKELAAATGAFATALGDAISHSGAFRSFVTGATNDLKIMTQVLTGDISGDDFVFSQVTDELEEISPAFRHLGTIAEATMKRIEQSGGPAGERMREIREEIEGFQRSQEAFSVDNLTSLFSNLSGEIGNVGQHMQDAADRLRSLGQVEAAENIEATLAAVRGLPEALTRTSDASQSASESLVLFGDAGAQIKESLEGQVAALENEILALQKGEQAALRSKLTRQALQAETEAERQKLMELVDTIIELTETRDAHEEQIEAEKKAEERLQETRSRVSAELDSMLRQIDPVIKARRELAEAQMTLEEAERAGREVTEEHKEAILDHFQAQVQAAEATRTYEEAIRRQLQTMNEGSTAHDAVARAVRLAEQAIRDGVTISNEWLDTLRELAGDHDINVNFNQSGKPPSEGDGGEGGRFTSDAFISRAAGTASQIAQQEMGLSSGGIGSMVGSVIGSAWGPIGTAVGGLIGSGIDTLFGSGAGDEPTFRFASSQPSYSDLDQSRQTPFGGISTGEVYNVDQGQIEDILNQVAEFDRRLTGLFDPADYDAIANALQNMDQTFEGSMANAQAVMEERFITALQAAKPELVDFIEGFGDLENMMRAFAGIESMQRQIDDLDNAILSLSENGVDQLRASINRMDRSLEDAQTAWERAQASQDPEQIASAGEALKQQILERYRFERDLIRSIENDLEALADSTRDFNRNIAETIAELSGSSEELLGLDRAELSRTRAGVLNAEDATEGLERIGEFTSAVENWLDTSIQRVEELRDLELERINQAIGALRTQQEELQSEADEIMAAAERRAQRAQQAAQAASRAASQAAERARKKEIEALEAQLEVAEEMEEVAQRAGDMLADLRLSSTSPASGFSRLAMLNEQISGAEARFERTGSGEAANEFMDLLEQRLQLIEGEGLLQRGSTDFLDVFNETTRALSRVEEQAQEAADPAQRLREQIADLQGQTKNAVSGGFSRSISAQSQLSRAEQQRLEEIKEEQGSLEEEIGTLEEQAQTVREEARDEIEALKKEAIGHFEWARTEREAFADERNLELTSRLDEITGELDSNSYLAQLQEISAGHLRDISGTMEDLLTEWRQMTGNEEGSGGGLGPGGGGGGPGPFIPQPSSLPTSVGAKGGDVVHVTQYNNFWGVVDGKGADRFVRRVGPKLKDYGETA